MSTMVCTQRPAIDLHSTHARAHAHAQDLSWTKSESESGKWSVNNKARPSKSSRYIIAESTTVWFSQGQRFAHIVHPLGYCNRIETGTSEVSSVFSEWVIISPDSLWFGLSPLACQELFKLCGNVKVNSFRTLINVCMRKKYSYSYSNH